jgi:hypothetical protein
VDLLDSRGQCLSGLDRELKDKQLRKKKGNIQCLLYCMVHNVEKIANYGFA